MACDMPLSSAADTCLAAFDLYDMATPALLSIMHGLVELKM